jgi:hypothetical protein
MHLLHTSEIRAHFSHLSSEIVDAFEQGIIFEITHHLVPVFDRINAVQAGIKEKLQIVFFFSCRDGIDYLIAVQVAEEVRG